MSKQTIRGRKPAKGPSVFSKNLRALMTEKGLSAREVSKICGVKPNVITTWLAGANPSDSMAVLKLCDSTGANFQFLMTGVLPPHGNSERMHEMFVAEPAVEFSGIFLIEAKRLKLRK